MNGNLKTLQEKLADIISFWQKEKEIALKCDARQYVYFLEGRIDGLISALSYLTDLIKQDEEQI